MNRDRWHRDQDADEPDDQSQDREPRRNDRFPTFGNYCASVVGGFASLVLLVIVVYPALLTLLGWAKPILMEWGLEDFAKGLKNRFRRRVNPLPIEYGLYMAAACIVAYPFLAAINLGWRKVSGVMGRDRSRSRKTRIS